MTEHTYTWICVTGQRRSWWLPKFMYFPDFSFLVYLNFLLNVIFLSPFPLTICIKMASHVVLKKTKNKRLAFAWFCNQTKYCSHCVIQLGHVFILVYYIYVYAHEHMVLFSVKGVPQWFFYCPSIKMLDLLIEKTELSKSKQQKPKYFQSLVWLKHQKHRTLHFP